jgi:hypothetical protein
MALLLSAPLAVGTASMSAPPRSEPPPQESIRSAELRVQQATPEVDSVALLRDLSILSADSMEGRAPGTEGGRRAKAFLVRSLEAIGVAPLGDRYRHPFDWPGGAGENVLGSIPGTDETGTVIVLTAHFDHEGVRNGRIFNGADDNASGVAAVLEVARRILVMPLRNTLVVALLDAEEEGLRGARAFVEEPPVPLERVALNVNLDMVSRTGGLLWAAGAHHTPPLRPVLEAVAADAPVALRLGHDRPGAPEGDDWTSASDHGPFHAAGIPFVYFGVEDHPDYHRPTDDFERIDPGEYVDAVRTILSGIRALDAALPLS